MQPSPHTLRGAETNFYAEAVEQSFGVDMLGQRCLDRGKTRASSPGAMATARRGAANGGRWTAAAGPLGEKTLTRHVYAQTGDFPVVLTTHFQGTIP